MLLGARTGLRRSFACTAPSSRLHKGHRRYTGHCPRSVGRGSIDADAVARVAAPAARQKRWSSADRPIAAPASSASTAERLETLAGRGRREVVLGYAPGPRYRRMDRNRRSLSPLDGDVDGATRFVPRLAAPRRFETAGPRTAHRAHVTYARGRRFRTRGSDSRLARHPGDST